MLFRCIKKVALDYILIMLEVKPARSARQCRDNARGVASHRGPRPLRQRLIKWQTNHTFWIKRKGKKIVDSRGSWLVSSNNIENGIASGSNYKQ